MAGRQKACFLLWSAVQQSPSEPSSEDELWFLVERDFFRRLKEKAELQASALSPEEREEAELKAREFLARPQTLFASEPNGADSAFRSGEAGASLLEPSLDLRIRNSFLLPVGAAPLAGSPATVSTPLRKDVAEAGRKAFAVCSPNLWSLFQRFVEVDCAIPRAVFVDAASKRLVVEEQPLRLVVCRPLPRPEFSRWGFSDPIQTAPPSAESSLSVSRRTALKTLVARLAACVGVNKTDDLALHVALPKESSLCDAKEREDEELSRRQASPPFLSEENANGAEALTTSSGCVAQGSGGEKFEKWIRVNLQHAAEQRLGECGFRDGMGVALMSIDSCHCLPTAATTATEDEQLSLRLAPELSREAPELQEEGCRRRPSLASLSEAQQRNALPFSQSCVSEEEDEEEDGAQEEEFERKSRANTDCADLPLPSEAQLSQWMSQGGLVGLRNLGNTCFLNAALQCLSAVKSFTRYFLSGKFREEINQENCLGSRGAIATAFAETLEGLWTQDERNFAPKELKRTIARFAEQFRGQSQEDSQELLAFLLDGIHEDLNRVKKKTYYESRVEGDGKTSDAEVAGLAWKRHLESHDSVVVDTFQGLYRTRLFCPRCRRICTTFDPFISLSLPIPPTAQLRFSFAPTLNSSKPFMALESLLPPLDRLSLKKAALRVLQEVLSDKGDLTPEEREEARQDILNATGASDLGSLKPRNVLLLKAASLASDDCGTAPAPPKTPLHAFEALDASVLDHLYVWILAAEEVATLENPEVFEAPRADLGFAGCEAICDETHPATRASEAGLGRGGSAVVHSFDAAEGETTAATSASLSPDAPSAAAGSSVRRVSDRVVGEGGFASSCPASGPSEALSPGSSICKTTETTAHSAPAAPFGVFDSPEASLQTTLSSHEGLAERFISASFLREVDLQPSSLKPAFVIVSPSTRAMHEDVLRPVKSMFPLLLCVSTTTTASELHALVEKTYSLSPSDKTAPASGGSPTPSGSSGFFGGFAESSSSPIDTCAATSASEPSGGNGPRESRSLIRGVFSQAVEVLNKSFAAPEEPKWKLQAAAPFLLENFGGGGLRSRGANFLAEHRRVSERKDIANDGTPLSKILRLAPGRPALLFLDLSLLGSREFEGPLASYSAKPSSPGSASAVRVVDLRFKKRLSVDVAECLARFVEQETLDEDNLWYCNVCKAHVHADHKLDLWRLPRLLILHLKRFQNDSRRRGFKVKTGVRFPFETGKCLDLTPFVLPEGLQAQREVDPSFAPLYELIGVNVHQGDLAFGHYFAFTKIRNQWYEFNDSCVTPVGEGESEFCAADACHSEDAYMLFYQLKAS